MFESAPTEPVETPADRPADRRRAATRREILDAAWALCRRHGLAGLSLRDLAAEVGMRAPSLYSYFASKEAIYDAMFAEGQRQLVDHLAFLPREAGTRDDLHAGARAFFEFCTADPVRYQLMFQRVVPGFEPSPESYALAVATLEHLAGSLAAAGVTDRRHVDLWTAVLTGLTDQQISNDPGGDRWGRLLDEAVELLCDHAGVPRTPTPRSTP
ncbi:MAG TPA: TetR/AcrR family transcriptional regulator [Acidimicrobiales bacterium]|nr:TetR/AcrR family transcriptional regulator [Acidimicrobiales bacterium]